MYEFDEELDPPGLWNPGLAAKGKKNFNCTDYKIQTLDGKNQHATI